MVRNNAQQLDNTWTVTVGAQSVQVNSDGSFIIPNISAPDQFGESGPGSLPDLVSDDFVRLIGTKEEDGEIKYVFSDYFKIVQNQTIIISQLNFPDTPPRVPESIEIAVESDTGTQSTSLVVDLDQTIQLIVTANYGDGTMEIVSTSNSWTSYRISNPNIARVDKDGLVTPLASGKVFVTAVNEGASAVIQIEIAAPVLILTSATGFVFLDGDPVGDALVEIPEFGFYSQTNIEGRYTFNSVPASAGMNF